MERRVVRGAVLAVWLAYAGGARSAEPRGDYDFPITIELGPQASLYIQHGDYEKTYLEGDVIVIDVVDDTLFINDFPYRPRRPRPVPPDLEALKQMYGEVPFVQELIDSTSTADGWLQAVRDWNEARRALSSKANQTWQQMLDRGADGDEAADALVGVFVESALIDSVTIHKRTEESLLVYLWWCGYRDRFPLLRVFSVVPAPAPPPPDPLIVQLTLLEPLLRLDRTRKTDDRPLRLDVIVPYQPLLTRGARAPERGKEH